MNRLRTGLLIVTVAAVACGGDDGNGDTGMTMTPTTDAMDDGDTAMMDDGDTAMMDDDDTAAMAGPPEITMVTWTQAAGCMMNTGSDVTVAITVTDPDNSVDELTFSGTVAGCVGDDGMVNALTGPNVTLVCPQASPYMANLTVEDPDGNMDMLSFTIDICVDGSAP